MFILKLYEKIGKLNNNLEKLNFLYNKNRREDDQLCGDVSDSLKKSQVIVPLSCSVRLILQKEKCS